MGVKVRIISSLPVFATPTFGAPVLEFSTLLEATASDTSNNVENSRTGAPK